MCSRFLGGHIGPHLVMLSEVETSLSSRASCVHSNAVSVETPSASLVPLNQEGQFVIFIPRLLGGQTPPLRVGVVVLKVSLAEIVYIPRVL